MQGCGRLQFLTIKQLIHSLTFEELTSLFRDIKIEIHKFYHKFTNFQLKAYLRAMGIFEKHFDVDLDASGPYGFRLRIVLQDDTRYIFEKPLRGPLYQYNCNNRRFGSIEMKNIDNACYEALTHLGEPMLFTSDEDVDKWLLESGRAWRDSNMLTD